MKITLKPTQARNPIVAHARFRRAGSHRAAGGAMRQETGRALRREIDLFHRTKDSP